MLFTMLVWPQEEGRMNLIYSQRHELLLVLGVGILIEGLIAYAMFTIGSASVAINLFLIMFVIILFC